MSTLRFTLKTLETAKLGLEAMIEEERCGDTFMAAALNIDRINVNIELLERQLEADEEVKD